MTTLIDSGKFSRKLEQVAPLEDLERIPIVDADTHITEPADLWTSRVSTKRWGDQVPHVGWVQPHHMMPELGVPVLSRGEKHRLGWFIGDTWISEAPAGTNAGWKLPPPSKPPTYEDAHPASLELSERLKLMNQEGVWAQVLYPNVAGFGAQKFLSLKDPELMLDCVRAYNDFEHDWAAPVPERFVKICATPFWDVKASVAEIERCYGLGFRGILFCSSPQDYNLPYIADPHWDPIWETAVRLKMPVNLHIGAGDVADLFKGYEGAKKGTAATAVVLVFMNNARALMELCMGGVFARFPELTVVSVESGIGWIPFVLEAMDHQFFEMQVWEGRPDFEMLPSEYFKRNVRACFWFERIAPSKLIHEIGVKNCLFETDFPHPTSLYPPESVRAHIARALRDESQEVRSRLLSENAAELYDVRLPADMSWKTAG